MECEIGTAHKNNEVSAVQEPHADVEGNHGGASSLISHVCRKVFWFVIEWVGALF